MELQFERIPIPYLKKIAGQIRNQEQTLEVRLGDGMPDIGRVICSWGQVILRGKEWQSERIGVSGGIMTWVLYAPEDEGQPQSVSAWIGGIRRKS